MKVRYTIEELYAIMYKNELQNLTFEDALSDLSKLDKVKAEESKDAAPMIGNNPFSGKSPFNNINTNIIKDFNDSLNHRVNIYKNGDNS